MSSNFKRVNNIGRTEAFKFDKLSRPSQKDSLFERYWEELVIRFDRLSRSFVAKTSGSLEKNQKNAEFKRIKG
jgi:hypothetical protein